MQEFKAFILTYKTAPVPVREQVALSVDKARALLNFLKENTSATDILVVSTCNRTEVYYQNALPISSQILFGIKTIKQIEDDFSTYFREINITSDAIRHLFNVSIGLDAQVIGDLQISGQVKNAYQLSADEDTAGPFLHRLMHSIFYTNKRVVQETSFRDGAASISYAAKELAEDVGASLQEPKVLVIGVGEIGRDFCLNLTASSLKDVTVINRTQEKAAQLANECGFKSAPFTELEKQVLRADIVISSVAGAEPIISSTLFNGSQLNRHKFFIDLSMPRSIHTSIEQITGIVLYNLDDLREKTDQALVKRRAAIPSVEKIIIESLTDFNDWSKDMLVMPTIQKLKQALEQIRKEEIARFLKKANAQEAEKMEELSKSLVQKFMKLPVLQLKAACKREDADSLVQALQELFDLEKTTKSPS
jgi:glutamyl-tRNA reductase